MSSPQLIPSPLSVYFLYPETAHRSLEEIDDIFLQANPRTPWDVVKIAKTLPYRNHPSAGGVKDPEALHASEKIGQEKKVQQSEHVERRSPESRDSDSTV